MPCTQHPSQPVVGLCSRCDREICATCREERNGKVFCSGCAEFLDRRAQERGSRPTSGAGFAPPPLPAAAARTPALPPLPPPPPPPAAGDLYAGPPPGEGGHPGLGAIPPPPPPPPPGDLYQGPVGGDLYQGPTHGGSPTRSSTSGVGASTGKTVQGNFGRCLAFTVGAGILSAAVWYGIAAASGYKLGFIALIMGSGIGIAAVAGAGGGGGAVALVSVLVAALSMLGGDYLIARHYYDELVQEIRTEMASQVDYLADGRLSNDELADLEEMSPEEVAEIPYDELEDLRDSWVRELRAASAGGQEDFLPFGAFWAAMTGIKDLIFYFVGLGAALKVPMGKE
jgi:hypothetical protein